MKTRRLTAEQLAALRAVPVPSTGNRVAVALAIAEVTQTEVRRDTGINQQYISDLKRGAVPGNLRAAMKLAVYFGCRIEDLFPTQAAQDRVA